MVSGWWESEGFSVMKSCLTPIVSMVLAMPLVAQNYVDFFNYAAGTTVPGYTEQRGNWTCTGTTVQAQAGIGSPGSRAGRRQ